MRPIGIGVSDFKKIITTGCFYVDKTKFIEEITNNRAEVQLITRPRRFGKTLNMSMLKYFYDIETKEDNKELFNDLYIQKSSAMSEQGKYPVIFISFKDIKEKTEDKMRENLENLLKDLYNDYQYVRKNLNESELIDFDDIWLKKDRSNLVKALLNLCKYLKKYYNQDVILLIDEYDTPMVSAYENGYYDEIKNFFTGIYGSAFLNGKINWQRYRNGIMDIILEE